MHAYTNIYLKCDDDDDDDKRSEFVCANNAIFGFGKCFMPTTHSYAVLCCVHMPRLFFPIKTSHFRFYFYTISPWKNIYILASSLSSYSVCKCNVELTEKKHRHTSERTMKVEEMVVLVNKKWTNIYCRVLSG